MADFDGGTEAFLRANYPSIAIAPRQNFYFRDDYTDPVYQQTINDLHTSQHFFQNLPEIPGSVEAWHHIQSLGYETRICSAPLPSNEWCIDEKLHWIRTHLGAVAAKDTIIDSAKEKYDGIALIDDRPIIKNAAKAHWQHVMFDQPYNQNIETLFRLQNWNDVRLEHILARCAALYERIS